jgi:hypothetical protein
MSKSISLGTLFRAHSAEKAHHVLSAKKLTAQVFCVFFNTRRALQTEPHAMGARCVYVVRVFFHIRELLQIPSVGNRRGKHMQGGKQKALFTLECAL